MKKYLEKNEISASAICDIVDATYGTDFDLKALRDALSSGQIASKLWLTNELIKIPLSGDLRILIVGGWIGTLARIIFSKMKVQITSIDIDENVRQIANTVNRYYPFLALTRDMYDFQYYSGFDIVINTSCEHIEDVNKWSSLIKPGTLVVAQSNDFIGLKEHINCVHSEEELAEQLNLSEILYSGKLNLPGMYNRFMVIGKK